MKHNKNSDIWVTTLIIVGIIVIGTIFAITFTNNEDVINISGKVTKIEKLYEENQVYYTITFDYNQTYTINNDNINWVLMREYDMTLYKLDYQDIWKVKKYVEIIE